MKRLMIAILSAAMLVTSLSSCAANPAAPSESSAAAPAASLPASEVVTEDLWVNGLTSVNDTQEITITAAPAFGESDREFLLGDGADKRDLGKALLHYNDRFTFRVTYTGNTIQNYTILDAESGEDLGQLDAEGLYNAFDIRAHFECRDLDASNTGMVFLSQLEEGILYCCTVDQALCIQVDNDIAVNAVVYCEDSEYAMPEYQYFYAKNISTPSNPDFSVFSDLVFIHYTSYEDADAAEHLPEDQALPLSRYQSGDTVEVMFESCLWNDTDEDITIVDSNGDFVAALAAATVCGFDWMDTCDFVVK